MIACSSEYILVVWKILAFILSSDTVNHISDDGDPDSSRLTSNFCST